MMMNNWWKIMTFIILMISIMLNLSCSMNLFSLWITMEMNMLSFICLIYSYNPLSTNSMMKYFIIQSLASSLFLSMSLLSKIFYSYEMLNYMLTISMSMKLGLWPFHSWMIQISEGLNWYSVLTINSMQKIIPLNILNLIYINFLLLFIWLMTIIFSTILLFNQLSMRKLMILSSLNHLCWMMVPIFNNNNSWMIYMFFYFMIILSMTMMLNNFNLSSISQLKLNNINSMIMILSLFSMMGLPPLLGFLPKIIIIIQSFNLNMIILIIILSSFINSWIYMRILWNFIMSKFIINNNFNNLFNMELINLNLMMLMIIMIFSIN